MTPGPSEGWLDDEALALAARHGSPRPRAGRSEPVRRRFGLLERTLEEIDRGLRKVDPEGRRSPAREWLLENRHVILDGALQVRTDLTAGFLQNLPRIEGAPGGLRILAVARHLVGRGRVHVDLVRARRFLRTYQAGSPFTMGEIWAFPLLLRVALLEELAMVGAELAGVKLPAYLQDPASDRGGEGGEGESLEERAAAAVRLLRAVAREDWNAFFEAVSRVEDLLRKGDPAGVYPRMDFATRDRYRKVVEEVARWSGRPEDEVTRAALEAAAAAGRTGDRGSSHVGEVLLGPGRRGLERSLDCPVPPGIRVRRRLGRLAFPLYAGAILSLALALLSVLAFPVLTAGSPAAVVLAALFGAVPALSVAIALVNRWVPSFVSPRVLPKLSLNGGIPERWKTAVAVPCLLSDFAEVDALLERLELNYLGNRQRNLVFVLLTDFRDASEKSVAGEDKLLRRARRGIRTLNQRYGRGPGGAFLLLHRERRWNPAEGRWMGWERKRGKLEEFNGLLLSGDASAFPATEGDLDELRGVCFVLSLDADTFLPQDTARRLVGTLAHPLNRAQFDDEGRVIRGYTVIQPRVEILPSQGPRTRFSRVFEADRGVDLYSQAVSDIYQDLLGEGIFIGKGLYDVAAFEASLGGRVPENALLSHDLFEGVHGRAGLVSDVVLFEDFPDDLRPYLRRLHRWVRGDWQLLPWLLPRVPARDGGRIRSGIRIRGRWKILDNLRRSLLFPSLLGLLLAGWLLLPGSPAWWSGAAALVLGVPVLVGAGVVFRARAGLSRRWAFLQNRSGLKGSGTLRWILALIFLPHQARIEADAILRTLFRLAVSRKHLLEWTTAAHAAREAPTGRTLGRRWIQMAEAPALAVGTAALFLWVGTVPPAAGVLLVAWFLSPLAAHWTGGVRREGEAELTDEENLVFRSVARRTWAYFEEFMGPEDHWLPPDHFQESPRGAAAHRTSPTNIGLALTSALAAHELGYLTLPRLVATLSNTLDGMDGLDRHRGHLLNWYDTRRQVPLEPRYVSTVDSGNLAASLVAVARACRDLSRTPVVRSVEIQGLLDALREIGAVLREIPPEAFPPETRLLEQLQLVERTLTRDDGDPRVRRLVRGAVVRDFIPTVETALARMVGSEGVTLDPAILARLRGWIIRVHQQADAVAGTVEELAPWVHLLQEVPEEVAGEGAPVEVREALRVVGKTLRTSLPIRAVPKATEEARVHLETIRSGCSSEGDGVRWVEAMEKALDSAWSASALVVELDLLERRAVEWVDGMDFRFLFDGTKRLFHIGFDVSGGRLDASYYDLLASEARTASFLAAAKGDVPARHWLQLGRPFGRSGGSAILLSWSGTLFEYLMPSLFLRTPEGSLLHLACRSAIERQMSFASRSRHPWGVSESAYHHMDSQGTYQYRAFGIPDLAVRRDVGVRRVVTPYASILALPFRPRAVRDNLMHLIRLGGLGGYGLYEALDYGRPEDGDDRKPRIVRSFMAHHQGMILGALANHLAGNPLVEWFHQDPRTAAASYLLHERAPGHVQLERRLPHFPDRAEAPGRLLPLESWTPNPDQMRPAAHVLSNGDLSVLVTARGGGGIRWEDRAVTRWRTDPHTDHWGSWIYVRDLDDGHLWSATMEPVPGASPVEAVVFAPHEAEYRRRVQGISSHARVMVAPDTNVEIRHVVLINESGRPRRLRIASYGEPSLANPREDRRHPAFQKLFVESEYLEGPDTLHFRRRRSAPSEPSLHVMHALGAVTENVELVGWETDREVFLGRDGSPARPRLLERSLDRIRDGSGRRRGTSGGMRASLDPVFSLILEVELPVGGEAEITFLTGVAASGDGAREAVERFRSRESVGWARDRARSRWEEVLHRLELEPREIRVSQELLSAVLRPFHELREAEPTEAGRRIHRRDALWGLGVSGDHPIVLFRVTDLAQEERLDEFVRFYALWRRKGIRVDLLVLDETAEGYHHPVRDRIVAILSRLGLDEVFHQPGGVHHVPASRLDPAHRAALESAARVRIDAALGSTAQQLRTLRSDPIRLPPFVPMPVRAAGGRVTRELPRPRDLLLDNGLGGFSPDGREYVIFLEGGETTPAPWVNVVAGPGTGFVVSERGGGFTWAGNSAENRLTTWSNDPVLDRPGEVLYLRDEENGEFWSPTPGPAPAPGPHEVRHGAGYSRFRHVSHGLEQSLELSVAMEPGVKVVELRLRNLEPRPRRVTATYYAEWVLGGSREEEAPHVVTRFRPGDEVLLAENRFAPANGPGVAFLAAAGPLHGWTSDREEFLGRPGPAAPEGLRRIGLGQVAGAGVDPCGAVQVHVDLAPDGEAVVRFFLGGAEDEDEAVTRIRTLRASGAVERQREAVDEFWDGLLSRTRVTTPDPAMDLLLNRWARYQALSCRIWGRSAFYQSAGAFGFRDQLQDVLGFLMDAPELARDHILEAARHQFPEGDVLHWWHPPDSRGVRTRCSDDLLWLPFATASYLRATGDVTILDERVPFVEGEPLPRGEQEHYATFPRSDHLATLHDHCLRALDRGLTRGPNGLPLIGLSDWNDGMDRLGREGRGESVWLAWFASATARGYAEVCRARCEADRAGVLEERAEEIRAAVEGFAWDGDWYLRAVHDDGTFVGSAEDPECRIDSIAQSWSVLSGGAEPDRADRAMTSVVNELVDREHGLVLLLAPPFDRDPRWPGYIQAYPRGVRENGGQYTHAGAWVGWALAALGRGDEAHEVFRYLSPLSRAATREGAMHYRAEPYAVAGDVAGPPHHPGRGGWSWFTGSAAWMHRLGLEAILGFRPEAGGLRVDPCIPPSWGAFELNHRVGRTEYRFRVENPEGVSRGVTRVELDGIPLDDAFVPLEDDGKDHDVRIRLGPSGKVDRSGKRVLP